METSRTDSESDSDDESDSSSPGSESDTSESSCKSNTLLDVTYHLSDQKAISLEKEYIYHLCGSASSDQIAFASSDLSVSLFDLGEFRIITSFEGHSDKITNLMFNPNDPHQLVSSSIDGTIRFWDTRKAGKSIMTFIDDTADSSKLKPFLSFDVSKSGHFICAGTELFDGDAFLVIGDARNGKVLGGYWESHSDDITQVSFHPNLSDHVATGSSDGLINFYDLKSETEDDALMNSLNTESHVDKLGWYMVNGSYKGIFCILDTMDVQLWTQDGVSPSFSCTRGNVSKSTGWKKDNCYVINIHQAVSDELIFLTGSSNKESERLALLQLKNENLLVESELCNNKQRVCCSWYNTKDKSFVTGGESGILSLWKPGADTPNNKSSKVVSKLASSRTKPY